MTIRKDATKKPEGLVRLQAGVTTPANVGIVHELRRSGRIHCRSFGAHITN